MTLIRSLLSPIIIGLLLTGCQNQPAPEDKTAGASARERYVSIDGLWKCTDETALHFESITIEATMHISGSIQDQLSARGCFMWEGRFRDYWPLSDIQFNDTTGQLTFRDRAGSVYVGTINDEMTRITGMVYSRVEGRLVPEDTLDFVRAADVDVDRLFTPRVPGPDGSIRYAYRVPEQLDDGLQTGSIFQHISDSSSVYNLLERVIGQEFGRLESLLVIKDQEMILEEYFFGYDRTLLHNVFSVTKSITSLLTGIALDAHGMTGTDRPVCDFLPGIDIPVEKENGQITLEHVLTMTAGLKEEKAYFGYEHKALLNHILNLPLESKPGERFRYNSECPFLLGGIIYALEGKTADHYAGEKLFGPLGISEYKWHAENGVPHCQNGLRMLPRDMAKIGLLVLNDGKWKGRQVVPAEWISQSTGPHVSESPFFDYGYQWWHRSSENQPWWKEQEEGDSTEHAMAMAMGFGGQYIFVIKDLDMVIVTTASDYNESNGMAHQKVPMVIEEVVPLFE